MRTGLINSLVHSAQIAKSPSASQCVRFKIKIVRRHIFVFRRFLVFFCLHIGAEGHYHYHIKAQFEHIHSFIHSFIDCVAKTSPQG